jgi:hypothetical protein
MESEDSHKRSKITKPHLEKVYSEASDLHVAQTLDRSYYLGLQRTGIMIKLCLDTPVHRGRTGTRISWERRAPRCRFRLNRESQKAAMLSIVDHTFLGRSRFPKMSH